MESEIISWANKRLEEGGKEVSIKHFQDKVSLSQSCHEMQGFFLQTNKTSLPIIHLIDVIKPGVIDYSVVEQGESLSGEVSAGVV